jgi:myo-inositol-1(or 4)-monophosphatase
MRRNMDKIEKAMVFAYEKHKTQKRKTNNCPYFVHLMDVVSILYKNDIIDEDLIVAGFLHDVVEDIEHTGVTENELRKEFGERVTYLVMSITERDKSKTWLERKTESIEHLKTASKETKLLKCADKLSNIRDIYRDMEKYGEEKTFSHFKVGKDTQQIYYRGVLEQISEISDTQMYKEYKRLVEKVFD